MDTRKISWEIVIAGIAFIGIAVYLLNRGEASHVQHATWNTPHPSAPGLPAPHSPAPPLPSTIVIDLQNLDNLENLKNLKNLEQLKNLKHLEFELKNLDQLIRSKQEPVTNRAESTLERSLQQFEQKLQALEQSDFNIKLQDRKIYINKDYNVEEAAWAEVAAGVFVYRESFDIAPGKSVDLSLGSGNINIVGGDSETGELVIQATGNIASPETIRKRLKVATDIGKEKAAFSITSKEEFERSERINLEATLTLPGRINTDINTSGGHISATHLQGDQKLFTSGGHITLDDLTGTIVARTKGGHITGDGIKGKITLSTTGGHIRLEKASGSIDLNTGGGHIEIKGMEGQGQAKTSGGNISARITSLEGPLDISTSAGNVSIFLPRTLNADIEARGTNASIADVFNFTGTRTDRKIAGQLNGGGMPVTINCGYGNVAIKTDD